LKPLVSIVIPTFNGGHYLVETLKSALAQDYPNTEVIVVDDGSTTNIQNLIREFGDRVKLIEQENSGPGAARNLGVQASGGEFIAFLDHDDLWAPNKVSAQAEVLIHYPNCGLVYCYQSLIDEEGDAIFHNPPKYFPSGNVFEEFIKRNRITSFSATMVRRTAFFAVGGIDNSLDLITCDDYDLWLKLAANFEVVFSPGQLLFYRMHPGNFSKNYHVNMNAHVRVMEKCREYILANDQLAKHFDFEDAITENLFNCYRKFGFIFYYDFPRSNLDARKALKESLKLSPLNVKCRMFYFFTFPPFIMARKIKRITENYSVVGESRRLAKESPQGAE